MIVSNVSQSTRTFKCELMADGTGLGIRVDSAPSSWGQDWAIITDITLTTKRRFERVFGSANAIQCGDMISELHFTKLRCPDDGGIMDKVVKGYSSIEEALQGLVWHHRWVDVARSPGDDSDDDAGSPERQLRFGADTTVACTIKRLDPATPRTKVVKGEGPLKVLTIRTCAELDVLQQQDFLSRYHVVLASARAHASLKYATHIKHAARGKGSQYMERKMELLWQQVEGWCATEAAFQRVALRRWTALFEVVFWRRVVFDEFHESEAWQYRVREMLRRLGAVHKWGLSGTPPLGSPLAVAEVAGLLGYAHPSEEGNAFGKALYYAWGVGRGGAACRDGEAWFAREDVQRRLKEMAEGFVAGYIRQNTSALVERIGIVEHEELVEHAPEERLIYRQACHDKGVFDLRAGYAHISLDARAELLKRCAHFDMGEAAESASSAVNTLGELKRERVEKVEQQLWVEVARARLFNAWDPSGKHALRSAGVQHPDAQATVARVLASSVEEVERHLARVASFTAPNSGKLQRSLWTIVRETAQDGGQRLRPEVRLDQPVKETEYYRDGGERHAVVHAVVKRAQEREADRVLSDLAVCEHACRGGRDVGTCLGKGLAELAGLVDRARRSLQFYEQQLRSLTREDAGDEDEPCSICLEGTRDLQTVAILPCSHVFHSECIRAALAQQPLCPECRTPVQRSQVCWNA